MNISEFELKKHILERILVIAELEEEEEYKNFPFDAPLLDGSEVEGKPCMGIGSIEILELSVDIMEEYGVKVKDGDIKKLNSIDNIAEYILSNKDE